MLQSVPALGTNLGTNSTRGKFSVGQLLEKMVGSLVASGQIKLRRIDGWRKIAAVLSQHTTVAAAC